MKTLLLTGAKGDIGQGILQKFEQQDFKVLGPNRHELDLESASSIQAFLTTINQPIDAFVHCAGFNSPKLMNDLTDADLIKTFQINTFSFYNMTQYLLKEKLLNADSTILAISSIYGFLTRKGRLAYSAAKHALNGMVKTLALELGPLNIRVNGVAPGFVDTKMTRQNNSSETIEGFKQVVPLKRLATPGDIANVVYFLASNQNTYINGQCIIVDGGYSIGGFQE